MAEFIARSVEFENDRVTVAAVEHRAPVRVAAIFVLSLFLLRVFLRGLLLSGVSLVAILAALFTLYAALIVYWIGAPRRSVELDTTRRQLRLVTRGLLRKPSEIVCDFSDVRHCMVRAMGPELWLWNIDTTQHSLTLCALRDEYDAKRLRGLVAGLFGGGSAPRASRSR